MKNKWLMQLKNERNAIVQQYKQHGIGSAEAIRRLHDNEDKMVRARVEAKHQYAKMKKH